jgi:hypothetical protein
VIHRVALCCIWFMSSISVLHLVPLKNHNWYPYVATGTTHDL